MGLYDRDYTRSGHNMYNTGYTSGRQMRVGFPKLTPMVKKLLIINIAVFVAGVFVPPLRMWLIEWFSVLPESFSQGVQVWRWISYQFLHGGVWHVFLNMLALYFLGPTVERYWGSRRFLIFYLSCGVAGAAFYSLLVAVDFLSVGPMVGASGSILGLLAACAILFPHFKVFIIPFPFPVPIRIVAVGLTFVYILAVVGKGANAGGDAAHLAGLAAGAAYVWSSGFRSGLIDKFSTARRRKKQSEERRMQFEIDRILQKVHEHGIHSLSMKEKRRLKQATKYQRRQNQY
jgi:membrane associated rhomboid family serine protease